jgi:hypothetical protein
LSLGPFLPRDMFGLAEVIVLRDGEFSGGGDDLVM